MRERRWRAAGWLKPALMAGVALSMAMAAAPNALAQGKPTPPPRGKPDKAPSKDPAHVHHDDDPRHPPGKDPAPPGKVTPHHANPSVPDMDQGPVFEALLPRSITKDWTEERQKIALERIKSWVAGKFPLYAFFRPAVATYEFINALEIKPTDRIADIGCGSGALAIGLLEHGIKFKHLHEADVDNHSLDFLRKMLELTTYKDKDKITIHLSEMEDSKLPSRSFDKVLVINIPGMNAKVDKKGFAREVPPHALKFFKDLKRTLRPGGEIQVHFESGMINTNQRFIRKVDDPKKPAHANRRHTKPLVAAGLEIVAVEVRTIWGTIHEVVRARVPARRKKK